MELSHSKSENQDVDISDFDNCITICPKKHSKLDNSKRIRIFSQRTQLFISFFEQVRTPAMSFFLIVMGLEMIPSISISDGYPITGLPLLLVFIIQMMYDFFQGRLIESISRPQNELKVGIFIKKNIVYVVYGFIAWVGLEKMKRLDNES